MSVRTSVSAVVHAPVSRVFDAAVSIAPSDLIRPYGPLPGVAETNGADIWRTVGDKRRHTLTDGSSVDEELTAIACESHFAYRLFNFAGGFSGLVSEGGAEWRVTAEGADQTRIDWAYSFGPKGPAERALIWLIVKALWPGYLRAALKRVKEQAEQGPHENRDL